MRESQFHNQVGGRRRVDRRFINNRSAPFIRFLITLHRILHHTNNKQIAEALGISGNTLSLAAGGRAGKRLGPDGRSTTNKIVFGLIKSVTNYRIADNSSRNDHV